MAATTLIGQLRRRLLQLLAGVVVLILSVVLLLRFINPPTTAFMASYTLAHPDRPVQQEWVALEAISPSMRLAVIASEDQRFPHHWGVDVSAIQQAVSEYYEGGDLRGASTITQQTAKNLFLWNGRSLVRKVMEAGLALSLETLWSKSRVLEVYLNIAEFGPGIYGVEAASLAYFGVPARQLSPNQAARLAAVLPNPKVLNAANASPYVLNRASWIRQQMVRLKAQNYLQAL
ncbi:monofunctional biosynthetic peptidoglycan transglycosylase [Marinobacter sp. SS21]|uniref:monofunctional biosynthetic peptidoglycan transglycosylase n=1 Tax=Marinobacter sp. SS21 TaxID=2979460 RepID=UPI00232EE211|nr:monofunctional biosynthetic peptidoglycan transglycosylase [Marinobacter sp. SS21]MDC0661496.1 monofunctional biosynthetic peptidoglycan transglycosylase [Marinobacter sp. SS21]